jgi:hypothetical protein
MSSTRRRVLALYKELHRLGRDYPDPKYCIPFFLYTVCVRSSSRPPCTTAMISTPACAGCSIVRPIIPSFSRGPVIPDEALSLVENRGLTDPAEIEQALHFGEYIKNGTHVHTQSCVSNQKLHFHPPGWHGDYRNVGTVQSPQISLSEATLRLDRWRLVKRSSLIKSPAPVVKRVKSTAAASVKNCLAPAKSHASISIHRT